ncbi:hypothetical protein ASPACDRAFT_1889376 [Aspergillus aculeatus ATCC 16872]|uniref:AttH domain-containing protein n=1 Tax=Aspergillus aculeatus (strain ATCC 16872 / CBS 172.66 / WB 5094) TaxID=690307 RepID=A0A1L9WS15_ASPA1|nr:uncharacterized protein ASPACDRAFT_1889376 [Aspergillus aculeatus ATCC 16872]OJJ98932.1 hypothetical protein ASPACDRAFT_1889376 [Aspergillus aculeatus ATCC 16872]
MASSTGYLLTLPLILGPALSTQVCPRFPDIQAFPTTAQAGPANGRFTSCDNAFDSPKVQAANATTYDWCVTENFTNVDFVQIFGTFANGTTFAYFLFAKDAALVATMGDGSSGRWRGTGVSWDGSPDLSDYLVTLEASHLGFEGTFSMHSVALPHYPCSPKRANQPLEVLPGVGWANAVPDADVTVNMMVQGSPLSFIGTGYHDKTSLIYTPFTTAVGSWYWGHARIGPYSLVRLGALDANQTEYASGYVAYQGQIVHAACGAMKVRPTGANVSFPPQGDDALPQGFRIEVDLEEERGGVLEAELAANLATLAKPGYGRWIGTVNGWVGGVQFEGVSGYEMVNFF